MADSRTGSSPFLSLRPRARPSVVSRIAHEACEAEPPILPEGPWWRNLEINFARRPEGFDLGNWDRFRVSATAATDVVVRTVGASAVGALAMPLGYHPLRVRRLLRDAHIYTEPADSRDPRRFFKEPPRGVTLREMRPRPPYFRPSDGRCTDLRFESPFVPVNPSERRNYLSHRRNRIAHARYWRHDGPPRPTLIAVHGFSADPYWLNEWFFDLPRFYEMGCDLLLFTLPFHGRRRELWAPFSGHGFFAGGIARINEAFAQAIFDLRILVDYLLHERRAPAVGVTGISLGGFTSALLAAAERRLSFSIPNVPVVSLADLVVEWRPIGDALRVMLLAMGRSLKEIRHLLAATCPLTYPPALPRESLMIVGGVGDRMAPPKHSRLLWDHWGRPKIHWFPGSHLIHLDWGEYRREIEGFLTGRGFL